MKAHVLHICRGINPNGEILNDVELVSLGSCNIVICEP